MEHQHRRQYKIENDDNDNMKSEEKKRNNNNDNTNDKDAIEELGVNVHCCGKRHQTKCFMKTIELTTIVLIKNTVKAWEIQSLMDRTVSKCAIRIRKKNECKIEKDKEDTHQAAL